MRQIQAPGLELLKDGVGLVHSFEDIGVVLELPEQLALTSDEHADGQVVAVGREEEALCGELGCSEATLGSYEGEGGGGK